MKVNVGDIVYCKQDLKDINFDLKKGKFYIIQQVDYGDHTVWVANYMDNYNGRWFCLECSPRRWEKFNDYFYSKKEFRKYKLVKINEEAGTI